MNQADRKFGIALSFVVLLTFGMHLRTLSLRHIEPDELIYAYLACRLSESPMHYDLQGALTGEEAQRYVDLIAGSELAPKVSGPVEILYFPPDQFGERKPRLDPTIYDRPIFHHPPAYAWLLSWMHRIVGVRYGVLLSAFFHGLAVLFTALLARTWCNNRVGFIAGLILATESVSWVNAERIWIDAMLQALVAASLFAAIWAARRGTLTAHVVAGLVFAAATLTKLPGCLIAPAVYLVWRGAKEPVGQRNQVAYLLAGCTPVCLWLLVSARIDGALLRFTMPTDWMIENFPYMARVVERSPLYYFVALLFASPVLYVAFVAPLGQHRQSWMKVPLAWAGMFFLFLTVVGLRGLGFQLRFLAPMIPALCILAAAVMSKCKTWQLVWGGALLIYSLRVGMQSAMVPGSSGLGLPKDFIYLVHDVLGFAIPEWFLRIW